MKVLLAVVAVLLAADLALGAIYNHRLNQYMR